MPDRANRAVRRIEVMNEHTRGKRLTQHSLRTLRHVPDSARSFGISDSELVVCQSQDTLTSAAQAAPAVIPHRLIAELMSNADRPFLAIYVAWHPAYAEGEQMAQLLHDHFRRKLYENVTGGTGLSVLFRSAPAPGSVTPLLIQFDEAETTAIVVLAESNLVRDKAWCEYVRDLAARTEEAGFGARLFVVALEQGALSIGIEEQALRLYLWEGDSAALRRRLIRELAYEFCRMLRHYLEHLKHPLEEEAALEIFLKKVQIFLSHSKHDEDGVRIAMAIRQWLQDSSSLGSFFDVHDIPGSVKFQKVLLYQVKMSAVVAIHTDSYSAREWCRKEIIEAKRWCVPLIVANCINDLDERGFPYMANVPIVRMNPKGPDRIDIIIGRLIDEVLKDFLWRCRTELAKAVKGATVVFVSRPPELISLAALPPAEEMPQPLMVYPDPPLSAEEAKLFADVAPRVRLRSMTEWIAESGT